MKILACIFLLGLNIVFMTNSWAFGEKSPESSNSKIAKQTLNDFLTRFHQSLVEFQKDYNSKRNNIKLISNYFKDQKKEKFLKLAKNTKKLVPIKRTGLDFTVWLDKKNKIVFSAHSLYENRIQYNDMSLSFKSLESFEEIRRAVSEGYIEKKVSWLNFIISNAYASEAKIPVIVNASSVFGGLSSWIGTNFDPDFEEAKSMATGFQRVKEISNICEVKRNGLLENLKSGVWSENKLIHHLLWETGDDNYDRDKLVNQFSIGFASNCNEFAKKFVTGITSKDDVTISKLRNRIDIAEQAALSGKENLGPNGKARYEASKIMNCEEVKIKVSTFNKDKDLENKKYELESCVRNSCNELVSTHDQCLKSLHANIGESDRERNAEKANKRYIIDWAEPLDSSAIQD